METTVETTMAPVEASAHCCAVTVTASSGEIQRMTYWVRSFGELLRSAQITLPSKYALSPQGRWESAYWEYQWTSRRGRRLMIKVPDIIFWRQR